MKRGSIMAALGAALIADLSEAIRGAKLAQGGLSFPTRGHGYRMDAAQREAKAAERARNKARDVAAAEAKRARRAKRPQGVTL